MTDDPRSLDCPECGEPVFVRPPGIHLWMDGEKTTCGECGARLRVSVEEDLDDDSDEEGVITMIASAEIDEDDHDA